MTKRLGWLALLAVGGVAIWIALPLPVEVSRPDPVPSLELEDRYGVALRRLRAPDGSRGGWVPIEDVDPKLIQAFVAIEDHRFFDHSGIDITSVGRAVGDNFTSGRVVSGASTLSMQTARLLRGMNRGWSGKLRQALWAVRLDAHLSKSQILEIYLNHVPLGQGAVGVAAASELYFGVSATRLSLAQAAMLAGIARRPSATNPFSSEEKARARRSDVLQRMATLGWVDSTSLRAAEVEPTGVEQARTRFLAPHFTTHVIGRGIEEQRHNGVRTTLDLDLQRAVESEVRHAVLNLKPQGAEHAAAVVLDNRTGGVLAWVGSPDFFADSVGQVDMVTSLRQPGSALKPFLYGAAFDRGYTAATVLPDVPRTYSTPTGPYSPRNYDRTFHGPVRMREALASSYNVPAVELAERFGASPMLGVLHAAGFASLDRDPEHYGLGLSLGNGEVALLELANAYRGLANGGISQPVRFVLGGGTVAHGGGPVANGAGTLATAKRFMSETSAALVLDILSDPVARIGGFGTETVLEFPFPVAAKTGTSRHFTDNWAVATTQSTTVAVWVGNFSGNPMESVSGITGAGPLLRRVVFETAERYPPGSLTPPAAVGATMHRVCALSGLRAHERCPSLLEWFAPGTAPSIVDTWQADGTTQLPSEYAEWAAGRESVVRIAGETTSELDSNAEAQRSGATVMANGSSPAAALGTEASGRPTILSPRSGDVYEVPPAMDESYATVSLVASAEGAEWSVNHRRHDGTRWRIRPGDHWIMAMWPSGARDSVWVSVREPRGTSGN